MRMRACLTEADAVTMMAACRREADKQGYAVSIAIVDDGGALLRLERMDGVSATSATVATRKAGTAGTTGKPSRFWEERVGERQVFLTFPGNLPIIGGVPIIHEGDCVGGIGVSGAPSEIDEQIALAGVSALVGPDAA
ncbi:GlcG/HbpS family heme-binding protein [Amorphus orientalis]|uniref:Glc operon protein GlcG n=1 Tax=Amorphus orientalis TaxID=649198 RepID=A0AAE4AQQ0_9HYPH|nr:heme-binding protein [Amorphus orientalis]MDQ0314336.1 glc operon protein GlcG [Amorphus orientalis]